MQNRVQDLRYRKRWGLDSNQLPVEDGRLDLDLIAHMAVDAGGVGRDSRNVGREKPQDAGSAAGVANSDGMTEDAGDAVGAADPAALNGDDAVVAGNMTSAAFFALFIKT